MLGRNACRWRSATPPFILISCILTVCRRTCRTEFLWAAWCLSCSAAAAARMGVVLGLDAPEAAGKRLKSLYDAAPEQARLSDELLRLVYYLKEHTFCTYYEAVKAIIPLRSAVQSCEYRPCTAAAKSSLCAIPSRYTGAQTPPAGTPYRKQQAAGTRWLSAPKHRRSWKRGVTKAVLAGLVKKGVLVVSAQDKSVALYENYSPAQETIALSPAQQAAFSRLAALMDTGRPAAVLHGVTSSGKTLVF